MNSKLKVVTLLFVLPLVISGCSSTNNIKNDPTPNVASEKTGIPAEKESLYQDEESLSSYTEGEITSDEAITIAFEKANVTAEEAVIQEVEPKEIEETEIWLVEFDSNGYEYEYGVDVFTGEIVTEEIDQKVS